MKSSVVTVLVIVVGGVVGAAEDLTAYVHPNVSRPPSPWTNLPLYDGCHTDCESKTGDAGGGNTFPGVTWPLGMVKLGPDLYDGSDSYSGYHNDGNFTGFSMLHESGTGGAPKYGVVSQMPVLGNITNPLADHNDTRAQADVAEVGSYQAFLGSGITVALAGTERAGFYEYTFPATDEAKNVLVDVSHVLSSYRGQGLQQAYLGGNMDVINGYSEDGYYQGYGSYNNVSVSLSSSSSPPPLLTQHKHHRVGTAHQSGRCTFAATLILRRNHTRPFSARATPMPRWLHIPPATA